MLSHSELPSRVVVCRHAAMVGRAGVEPATRRSSVDKPQASARRARSAEAYCSATELPSHENVAPGRGSNPHCPRPGRGSPPLGRPGRSGAGRRTRTFISRVAHGCPAIGRDLRNAPDKGDARSAPKGREGVEPSTPPWGTWSTVVRTVRDRPGAGPNGQVSLRGAPSRRRDSNPRRPVRNVPGARG